MKIFDKDNNTLKHFMFVCVVGIVVLISFMVRDSNTEISSLNYKTVSDWAKNKHQYPKVMKAIKTSVKDNRITVTEYRYILNLVVDINEKEYQEEKSKNIQIIKTQTKD